MLTQVSGYIQSLKPLRWFTAFCFVPRFTCQKCFKWDLMWLLFPPQWVLPFSVWNLLCRSDSLESGTAAHQLAWTDQGPQSHLQATVTCPSLLTQSHCTSLLLPEEQFILKGQNSMDLHTCLSMSIYRKENQSGEKHRTNRRSLVKWSLLNLNNFLIPKRNMQSGQIFRLNDLQLF